MAGPEKNYETRVRKLLTDNGWYVVKYFRKWHDQIWDSRPVMLFA